MRGACGETRGHFLQCWEAASALARGFGTVLARRVEQFGCRCERFLIYIGLWVHMVNIMGALRTGQQVPGRTGLGTCWQPAKSRRERLMSLEMQRREVGRGSSLSAGTGCCY